MADGTPPEMMESFLSWFSFAERASGLANFIQVTSPAVAISLTVYGVMRRQSKQTREYGERLEDLLAIKSREAANLESELEQLNAKSLVNIVNESRKQRAAGDDAASHEILTQGLNAIADDLCEAYADLAGDCLAKGMLGDLTKLREAKRLAQIALMITPANTGIKDLFSTVDAFLSMYQVAETGLADVDDTFLNAAINWDAAKADPEGTLIALRQSADSNWKSGHYATSERFRWRARQVAMNLFPPTSEIVLDARTRWAMAMQICGQIGAIRPEITELLQLTSEYSETDSKASLRARMLKVDLETGLGDANIALSIARDALERSTPIWGELDHDILTMKSLQLAALIRLKKIDEAINFGEQLVVDSIDAKGRFHQDTLSSRILVGIALGTGGMLETALAAFDLLWSDIDNVLEEDFPMRFIIRRQRADLLAAMNRQAEAIAVLQPLCKDVRRVLGPGHVETQMTDELLAAISGTTAPTTVERRNQMPAYTFKLG